MEKQAELGREFAAAQTAQVAQGQLSALDAASARFSAREIELGVADLRAGEIAAAAALATVLGRESDTVLEAVADLALPPEAPAPRAPGPRADLALAEKALAAGDADLSLARIGGEEGYAIGLFVEGEQERADLGGREHDLMIGLRFSLPLPVRAVTAPAVAEKQAARRRLALERDALALAARNQAAATAAAVQTRHAAASAVAAELLPAAREHLTATVAAFERGELELARVFSARTRLAEIERADLAARHAYHLAAVRHLAATGHLITQP